MRYTSGWVARESLTSFQRLSSLGGQGMEARGFYIIADKFFEDFPDPYLKGNKSKADFIITVCREAVVCFG